MTVTAPGAAPSETTRPGAPPRPSAAAGTPAPPRAVILDTNAILLPFTEGTRVEELLEELVGVHTVHVPTSVVNELNHLSQNGGELGRAAKMALKLAHRYIAEPTGRMGDDGILEVARRLKGVVVSNDRKLQAECQKSGLQVLVSRERGRLALLKSGSG